MLEIKIIHLFILVRIYFYICIINTTLDQCNFIFRAITQIFDMYACYIIRRQLVIFWKFYENVSFIT